MSKTEILAELSKLSAADRTEIWEQLWHIEAKSGPNATEQQILNEAQADYDANPGTGSTWSEVEARLRSRP